MFTAVWRYRRPEFPIGFEVRAYFCSRYLIESKRRINSMRYDVRVCQFDISAKLSIANKISNFSIVVTTAQKSAVPLVENIIAANPMVQSVCLKMTFPFWLKCLRRFPMIFVITGASDFKFDIWIVKSYHNKKLIKRWEYPNVTWRILSYLFTYSRLPVPLSIK